MPELLSDEVLEQSGVVANCRMNRERSLTGSNGYSIELGFDPLQRLKSKLESASDFYWLDLCCGSGKALIEAAHAVRAEGMEDRVGIVGVDLVGMFAQSAGELKSLRLVTASLTSWKPNRPYDLITCVHGLHYLGDKLRLIANAASWLTANGTLIANFDLKSVKFRNGRSANRIVAAEMRKNGLHYDSRRKRLICEGHRYIEMPFLYIGADDQAGPNYTGQPAVNSYYEEKG